MKNLELHKEAVKKEICADWAKKLENASVKILAGMFFDGADWAFENDFPTISMLEEYKGVKDFGLHLDCDNEKFVSIENIAFFGDSKAQILYNNFEVAQVFARHNADIAIDASNYAILTIYVEDNAKVLIVKDETAKVTVKRYSGTVTGDCNLRDCKHGK